MAATTTVRGVVASPFDTVSAPAAPSSRGCEVIPGRTYELRTDAQTLVEVDGNVVAVFYPLVFVGEGGGGANGLPARAGSPFSRVSPIFITPQASMLTFSGEVAATVWVLQVSEACDDERLATPGGAGCGCGPKRKPCSGNCGKASGCSCHA